MEPGEARPATTREPLQAEGDSRPPGFSNYEKALMACERIGMYGAYALDGRVKSVVTHRPAEAYL